MNSTCTSISFVSNFLGTELKENLMFGYTARSIKLCYFVERSCDKIFYAMAQKYINDLQAVLHGYEKR